MTNETGPFLVMAVFCEKVIQDQSGSLSVIGILDQVTHTIIGTDVPDEMPPVAINIKAVIALKGGQAKGRYAVKLRPEDPSGAQLPAMEMPVRFEGSGASGVGLIMDVGFQAVLEGLYWFDLIFVATAPKKREDRLLTRIPLNVVYQPQKTGPA